jgi:selenocysteine lyase/cysteine desulfurase
MYAPYGTGALIGRRDTFLQGDPDVVGGGTVDNVTVDEVKWAGLPDKEEAGSPNVVGAVALAKTMLCLQEIGMAALAEHEARLTAYLLQKLARLKDGSVRLYGITDPARAAERVGAVPFNVEGMNHYLVAAILSAEGGIGVRNGRFCAHPYILNLLNVSPGQARAHQQEIRQGIKAHLPGLVRVSFGCYNIEDEVDWFIEVLEKILRGEYRGHYVQDPASGDFWPEGYAPEIAPYFTL